MRRQQPERPLCAQAPAGLPGLPDACQLQADRERAPRSQPAHLPDGGEQCVPVLDDRSAAAHDDHDSRAGGPRLLALPLRAVGRLVPTKGRQYGLSWMRLGPFAVFRMGVRLVHQADRASTLSQPPARHLCRDRGDARGQGRRPRSAARPRQDRGGRDHGQARRYPPRALGFVGVAHARPEKKLRARKQGKAQKPIECKRCVRYTCAELLVAAGAATLRPRVEPPHQTPERAWTSV